MCALIQTRLVFVPQKCNILLQYMPNTKWTRHIGYQL